MNEASDDTRVAQPAPDRNAELEPLRGCVEAALARARELGADAAEANASVQGGLSVTVRLGEVETIEHNRDSGISISVFLGDSKGHASSADLRESSVLDCVERAIEIARFTQPDACNGLADPHRLATEFPELDLWHPVSLDTGELIDRALRMEGAGRALEGITNSEGASCSGHFGVTVYGNSHGFVGESSGTRYGQSCVLIAGSGDAMQRDYWYDSRRAFDDLESEEETGRRAADRTVRRIGAQKVPTRKAPVLFAPEVARSLLGHFLGAVSGANLYRNASFLKDCLGEALFPEWLSVSEQPHLARGAGSAAFDAEGVATQDRDIVSQGVLESYVLSSYSARRLGMESTGNAGGVHNLRLDGPKTPLPEMLNSMGTGLLVTEMMGQGVKLVTGDYSRGATGFWVEEGEIAFPVEEVTIAGNLRDMFRGIQAVGDDTDHRGNVQVGSIWIDRMTVAGS